MQLIYFFDPVLSQFMSGNTKPTFIDSEKYTLNLVILISNGNTLYHTKKICHDP